MQQILNVLFGAASGGAGSASPEPSSATADGADFESIITKTAAYEESAVKGLQVKGPRPDDQSNASFPAEGEADTADAAGDGVSSVLAQIHFSRQFAADKAAVKGGEALPLETAPSEMQAATDGVIADNEQAIAVDALFLRFSALMKNADDAERDQIASQLGLTPSALTALDEDAFTGLLADNPSLKDALAKLLQTDIQGLESDIDAQEQLALFMQSLPQAAHTPSATDASLKSPSDNAAVDVAKSNLQSGNGAAAALTQAATRAPSGAKGLEVAMARVSGDAESDAAPIAYAAKADMAKADAGQTVDRGMASTVAADTLGIKGPESASPKDFSGIVSQASDASKPVNDEGLAASTSVREELPLKSLETIGRLAEPVANKSDLAAIETKSLAATESVSDLKAPSLHQARIHEAQPMTMSLRTAHERPMTQPDMVARFAPVMHTQLIAMVRDGIQQAEIRLDPPELGSMMVRIQVQGNETQVQFHVSAQQTKDVVEQAMPRLRELLAQQGMELTDGQVSHERRGDGRERQDAPEGNQFVTMDEFPAEELQSSANQTTSYSSGIDYYA